MLRSVHPNQPLFILHLLYVYLYLYIFFFLLFSIHVGPGVTGVIITLSLILMVTTAVDQIRRSYFELFWYTHHLFIVFYIALMLHGASGFINKQVRNGTLSHRYFSIHSLEDPEGDHTPLVPSVPEVRGTTPIRDTLSRGVSSKLC